MTRQENQKLVEAYLNAFTTGEENKLKAILADSYTILNPPPGYGDDKEGAIQMSKDYHTAFPDLKVKTKEWVIDGDTVVVRFVATGTHEGPFAGAEPTGRKATTTGIMIVKIAGGKIVEEATEFDQLGLFVQLGLVPEQVATVS